MYLYSVDTGLFLIHLTYDFFSNRDIRTVLYKAGERKLKELTFERSNSIAHYNG